MRGVSPCGAGGGGGRLERPAAAVAGRAAGRADARAIGAPLAYTAAAQRGLLARGSVQSAGQGGTAEGSVC